jgi:hypothetical protein
MHKDHLLDEQRPVHLYNISTYASSWIPRSTSMTFSAGHTSILASRGSRTASPRIPLRRHPRLHRPPPHPHPLRLVPQGPGVVSVGQVRFNYDRMGSQAVHLVFFDLLFQVAEHHEKVVKFCLSRRFLFFLELQLRLCLVGCIFGLGNLRLELLDSVFGFLRLGCLCLGCGPLVCYFGRVFFSQPVEFLRFRLVRLWK